MKVKKCNSDIGNAGIVVVLSSSEFGGVLVDPDGVEPVGVDAFVVDFVELDPVIVEPVDVGPVCAGPVVVDPDGVEPVVPLGVELRVRTF